MTDKHITILGLGNILLEDEGFGVHFLRYIETRYRFPDNVKLVDGGALGFRLLDVVCGPDIVIVIDVIKVEDEPGSIYRFNRQEMELRMPVPTSAHEVEFLDVLFQAELMESCPR
jgi:hydrogenase maturation protease